MLFSIIVPIYNVEEYLEKCISSVLAQSFTDYEIILVDDGSVDKSGYLCDLFSLKYNFIHAIHKENGGLSDTRNIGTNVAKGDYIIYLDSDDFILDKDFLLKLSKKVESNPDLIFYKYQKYFSETKMLEKCMFSYLQAISKVSYPDKLKALVINDAFYGMAWIKAIKRKNIVDNDIHFEVGLLGEDMDWNYQIILCSSSIEFIDESMIAYRQRKGSITTTFKLKNLTDYIYILEKWSLKINQEVLDETMKHTLYGSLAKYYSNLFIVYARLDDSKKAKYIEKIKKLDWLLKYSMSRRPRMLYKIYRICGFRLTIIALKILDRIK